MIASNLVSDRAVAADYGSHLESTVLAVLAENEFEQAQAAIPDLAGYLDHDDWLDAREGLRMGLAMAGVDAAMVQVRLSGFLEWRALAGVSRDEGGLDAFAALALRVRNSQPLRVFAVLRTPDFAQRRAVMAPVVGRDGLRGWRLRRDEMRVSAAAAGLRIENLPIRLDDFLAWCACVGERLSESNLDCYALLLLEHLTSQ